jgi:hypothetical protein
MIQMPTNYLILEGPDLSGKSTLYKNIHSASGYKWNIQDRSAISMLAYAHQFMRESYTYDLAMTREICDLNNRFVFLLPPWDVIESRFLQRGDDIQDGTSLKILYDIFTELSWVRNLPNVKFVPEIASGDDVANWVQKLECTSLADIADTCKRFLENWPKRDATLRFNFIDNDNLNAASSSIMLDPEEGDYYVKIQSEFMATLYNEQAGINEYQEPQDWFSRRFIFTHPTCISLIHMLARDDILNFHVTLRSSNVATKIHKDLQFVHQLARQVTIYYPEFDLPQGVNFHVTLNSAHLVR